ncbi:hypothetical protein F2Q70_00021024 [Brassica cretica]|uniref:Uncharacterized protein n=2 Tax=Brassica cretica TaxID=69181 RepID=A0A3N6R6T9_BRACR|nr:hypothetical protein F2Q70_00021024 [Brassica cretica]KAF2557514.1 hypothetical protein F2Q68_00014502 [Brassica cretica]KAF3611305.1 hypothetical protein DY000_02047004 [Brassica cretica]
MKKMIEEEMCMNFTLVHVEVMKEFKPVANETFDLIPELNAITPVQADPKEPMREGSRGYNSLSLLQRCFQL